MIYPIEFSAGALRDLKQAISWIARDSRVNAERWRNRIEAKFETLSHDPERCSIAPDADAFTQPDVRQLLFGKRAGVYRILFCVQDGAIVILRVMHAARRFLNEQGENND